MKNFYIFPNSVNRIHEDERIKVNITDGVITFFHFDGQKEQIAEVNTALLRDGSSTMVLNSPMGSTFVLYNFREIVQVMDTTPSEFLSAMQVRGFMQIDKCGGEVYIKTFLLAGDNELASDTRDFSYCTHCIKDFIHPLDWAFSWTLRKLDAKLEGSKLVMQMELCQSGFWQRDVYASHAGQTIRLAPGMNTIEFVFCPSENVYLGEPNCRYKGRAIEVRKLLEGGTDNGISC